MCGRFHRFDDVQKMATQFRAKYDESLFAPPTYNAPPQTWQPVIRLDQDGEREIVNMRWGLVPYWSKDDKTAFSTFNARAETILSSNTFRNAMRKRRCLVPVNGFYEWAKREKGSRVIRFTPGGQQSFFKLVAGACPALPLAAVAP